MHALGVLINHAVVDPNKLADLAKPLTPAASADEDEYVEKYW